MKHWAIVLARLDMMHIRYDGNDGITFTVHAYLCHTLDLI